MVKVIQVLFFFLASLALAQDISITAPPERLAAPGEFVTLVFRIKTDTDISLSAKATSEQGWTIVRQPGELDLKAGRNKPVAITVAIPETAQAFSLDSLSLELETDTGAIQASTTLRITESLSISIEAPREIPLEDERVEILVNNEGNVADTIMLSVQLEDMIVKEESFALAAQDSRNLSFEVTEVGLYSIFIESERGIKERSVVKVIDFGIPEPEPLALTAIASAQVDTGGSWDAGFSVEGPISDFYQVESRISMKQWRQSFAQVGTDVSYIRIGSGIPNPYRLSLSKDFGVSWRFQFDEFWSLTSGLGWVDQTKFSGYFASSYEEDLRKAAFGAGIRSGKFIAAARGQLDLPEIDLNGKASFSDSMLNASIDAKYYGGFSEEVLESNLSGNNLFSSTANLSTNLTYRSPIETLYGNLIVPIGKENSWDWSVGTSIVFPSITPGRFSVNLQTGLQDAFANVQYQADLGEGWQSNNRFGVVYDDLGFGLDLDTRWDFIASNLNFIRTDAQLTLYPAIPKLIGQINSSYQILVDDFTIFASGGWDIGERDIGISAGTVWQSEPWQLNASGNLSYTYQETPGWDFELSVSADYMFTIPLAEALVESAGGRRVGSISGYVRSGEEGIANVELEIGRFRIKTDSEGYYEAILPPDEYRVALNLVSLPVTFQLISPSEQAVNLALKQELRIDFETVKTAALEGRVLLDRDGDGSPDEPLTGSQARLLLNGADGLTRAIASKEDGTFSVRNLLPGTVDLKVVALPPGSVTVGEDSQTLTLEAGLISQVQFLVQPATARARSFSPSTLRIRRVTPQVDRAPPGTAPIVRVLVQGEADSVYLETSTGRIDLSFDGEAWNARLPIPQEITEPVLAFNVIARQENEEASRNAQLIISPDAPAFELSTDAPAKPKENLSVTVITYFQANSVQIEQPFASEALHLQELSPGRWEGTILIPADTEDAVYSLKALIENSSGQRYEEETTFRVLIP